jgi:hypothetical protein
VKRRKDENIYTHERICKAQLPGLAEKLTRDVSQTQSINHLFKENMSFDPFNGAGTAWVNDYELAETGFGPPAGTLVRVPMTFQRRVGKDFPRLYFQGFAGTPVPGVRKA